MHTPHAHIVLLPGLEGSGNLFEALAGELNARFLVQIVRYPASASSYDELRPLLEASLPQAPFILLAESFSTPLAVHVTAAARHDVRGLVLCNGFVSNPLAGIESMMAAAVAPWALHLPLTSVAARTFLVGPDAPESLVIAAQYAIKTIPPAVQWARLNAVFHCDARDALARITAPVLCLHATRDRLIGGAGLREIRRIRPDVQVEPIDGPHFLLQREPRRCAQKIMEFVESIQAALLS